MMQPYACRPALVRLCISTPTPFGFSGPEGETPPAVTRALEVCEEIVRAATPDRNATTADFGLVGYETVPRLLIRLTMPPLHAVWIIAAAVSRRDIEVIDLDASRSAGLDRRPAEADRNS